MTYRLHCWKWAASCPNRNEIRRRGRRALQVESLEARLLLYAVNDPGDAGLDPSVGPAETSNGTITFRSALDQIQLDGGGEIDLGGLTVNFSDESDPYLINGPAPLTLDGGGGTINGSVPSGGGAVSNVTITGGLSIQGDGSVTMAMVNGLTISGQGTLTNVTITGGGAEISGDGNVTSATVNGGLDIAGAGTVFDSTINGGLDIGGAAAVSTVTVSVQGGVGGLALSGGGTVTNATIAGDSDISDGGSISGSMFNGAVSFDAGGSLAGSTLATGPLYFSDGGSVTNSTITDGGVGASGGAVIQDDILTGAGAISLSGADNQVVGSNVSGGIMLTRGSTGDLIQGNTIWGNQAYLGDGIFLDSSGDSDSPLSSGNMIVDNMIGTDASGNAVAAAPNAGDGINIEGAWDTLIKGNVISGNTGYGISIINYSEEPSTGTMIVGNKIGTNGAGNAALPNGKGGVVASFSSSGSVAAVPGNTQITGGNVISGNTAGIAAVGIYLNDGGNDVVQGNLIGTDASGTAALPDGNGGSSFALDVVGDGNTIGGAASGAGNTISGNTGNGLSIDGDDNLVEGNRIGTDITGTVDLGNSTSGLIVTGSNNVIGGTATGAGNVIGGNRGDGIDILGMGSSGNVVEGNSIGTDVTGAEDMGNANDGVVVAHGTSNNTIGGPAHGDRNVISFNGGNGVTIGESDRDDSVGDAIEENSIFGNGALGIDLGDDGITPNDSMGHAAGPNHWQNFPTLQPPDSSGVIVATLGSSPGKYRIEFFSNTTSSASGAPQGKTFLGFASLTVGTGGTGTVSFTPPGPVPAGAIVSATATSATGDTSEFDVAYPLVSVTFGGDGFYPITSDVDPSFPTYSTQQWLGGNDPHQWPVLYGAGSTLSVSAEWTDTQSTPATGSILAKATASDGLTISPAPVTQQAGELLLPPVSQSDETPNPSAARATAPFENFAQYFPDFTIQWRLSFDGGKNWVYAGESDNPLYVSAAPHPLPDPTSNKFFLTVVDSEVNTTLGLSAGGASNNIAAVIGSTWNLFSSRSVRQFSPADPFSNGSEHGTPLTYYGTPSTGDPVGDTTQQVNWNKFTTVITVQQLLATGDGECMTFAELFLDMLLVSGVSQNGDKVTVKPAHANGFLVDNWTFVGTGTSGNPQYPYIDVLPQIVTDSSGTAHSVGPLYQVLKEPGVPGQNSANPAALFDNHVIAYLNGEYYDPSYGTVYSSLPDMASLDVAGYFNRRWVAPSALGLTLPGEPRVVYAIEVQRSSAGSDSLVESEAETWAPNGTSSSSGGNGTVPPDVVGTPISTVDPLSPTTTASTFAVSMTGAEDGGSGSVVSFELFVSIDGRPFVLYRSGIPPQANGGFLFGASTSFTGEPGQTYSFVSVATDNLGAVQPTPTTAQATTKVVLPPPVTLKQVQDIINSKHQVTEVLLTFSGPVNSAEADQIGTYRLATPGTGGSYTAKNAAVITLKSAVYTSANDTVALTPTKPFALTKPVQLLVYGTGPTGLEDTYGRLIDGDHNGAAGGNAVAILSKAGATIDALPLGRPSGPAARLAAVDAVIERESLAVRPKTSPAHNLGRGLHKE